MKIDILKNITVSFRTCFEISLQQILKHTFVSSSYKYGIAFKMTQKKEQIPPYQVLKYQEV